MLYYLYIKVKGDVYMEKEKTKLYQKWWFWVCIVLIVCVISGVIYFISIFNNNIIQSSTTDNTDYIKIYTWEDLYRRML